MTHPDISQHHLDPHTLCVCACTPTHDMDACMHRMSLCHVDTCRYGDTFTMHIEQDMIRCLDEPSACLSLSGASALSYSTGILAARSFKHDVRRQ